MKILIEGLWHLGCVTAAELTKLKNNVICFDENKKKIEKLKKLKLEIFEKSLSNIIRKNQKNNKLKFSNNIKDINNAKIYSYCEDTPIRKSNKGEPDLIIKKIIKRINDLKSCRELIISSQIPVGTIKKIERIIISKNKKINVTYIPENLRLGKAFQKNLVFDIKTHIKKSNVIISINKNKYYKKFQKDLIKVPKNKKIYIYDPFFLFSKNNHFKYI